MRTRHLPCVLVAIMAGCQATPKSAPATTATAKPPTSTEIAVLGNTDPSAMKLHDISGALLAYFMLHRELPERFEQLKDVADMADGPVDAAVPGTKDSYVYTREGIYLQDLQQWIVVYEPAPIHHGSRAVITIGQPKMGEALQTKVVAVPEGFFLLHPPGASGGPMLSSTAQKPTAQEPAGRKPAD